MVTPSSSTTSTGSRSGGSVTPIRAASQTTTRTASTYAVAAQASAASGAPTDRKRSPTISAMASTVNSSTHKMSRPMIWLCSYSAGTGPVTPTTWSAGRPRYQRAYSSAPAVCAPNEVPGRKYRNVMTVVDCSFVPFSRPAALGSGNAPASPEMPPGRSRTDRSAEDPGRLRLPGRGQRGRGLGELAGPARLPGQLPVHRQGLAQGPVPGRRRQPVRVALHHGHGRVDGEAEQPGRVALRAGRGRARRDQLRQPAGGGWRSAAAGT